MPRPVTRLLLVLTVSALLTPWAHAGDHPRTMDLTTTTCSIYLGGIKEGVEDEMFRLAAWLDGYMASISADNHVNWTDVKKFSEELTDYCRKHGNSTLMDAARNAGIL